MPHLASLLHEDLRSALGDGGVVLAAQRCVTTSELIAGLKEAHRLIDVNGWPELKKSGVRYEGFCW
jgi:hypothetical protein